MQITKDNLPVRLEGPGAKVQAELCDGMLAEYMQFEAGTDLTPLLEGLPGDRCQCEHWGYMLKGALHVSYSDGNEEVVRADQLFYMPPGHTVRADEDTAFVMFSPKEEHLKVYDHIARKMGQ